MASGLHNGDDVIEIQQRRHPNEISKCDFYSSPLEQQFHSPRHSSGCCTGVLAGDCGPGEIEGGAEATSFGTDEGTLGGASASAGVEVDVGWGFFSFPFLVLLFEGGAGTETACGCDCGGGIACACGSDE